MKLASNLLLTVFWQALGESLLLVDSVAMGESKVLELLSDSNIGATLLRARAGQITAALDGRASSPAEFDIDTMRKDLRYMALEASAESHSLPLASRVLGCFDRASSEGLGAMDGSAYPAYWIARQKAVVA
jgi:3-hydroxyisobutyrate dehydrogenase-like beta-hydroxyacid dehydrogenase